ncbi:hypothetical protein [Zhenpiania hominis]|uniref:Uncharacterized protein n=1 Tax=Zhenpiania hominis TaxID=2763644 RepID=A0A923NK88_9FIRM|nr:hypothetical protein [Zhenpiania hominis]MBC6679491.1 hypothetical protein [Zhenpiania hominis]
MEERLIGDKCINNQKSEYKVDGTFVIPAGICPILKISSVWTRFFEKITVRRRILSSASPKPLKIRKEKMSDKYTGQKNVSKIEIFCGLDIF